MLITHVIPAYNASQTIANTLESVFRWPMSHGWQVEAVVVDDGSNDGAELARVVAQYADARLVAHETNRGMCAGRNSGIVSSLGDIVTILDSDDSLVNEWPFVMEKIIREWPAETNICYAACQNSTGDVTAEEPEYQGFLTLNDILNERHSGEYIPLFRGNYVRSKPYVDLGIRKSCGTVSYINYALDGPLWVTNRVLRIYNDAHVGSVSHGWTSPKKAAETAKCYQELFDRYGSLYQREAPRVYRTKLLRYAVYLKLAGLSGAWKMWSKGISLDVIRESVGAAVILIVGASIGSTIVTTVKKIGLVRRYG